MMPQDPSSKIPEPCEDCGSYHTQEERDAFDKAQIALRKQMREIMEGGTDPGTGDATPGRGPLFDKMVAMLKVGTSDEFEATVVVAFLVHWLICGQGVPEGVFNRCFDTLLDVIGENDEMARLFRAIDGKKIADA